MYKIYLDGHGAEMTQGILPIETVLEINESLKENDIKLNEYIIDHEFANEYFDWYEIDDHFHCMGAYVDNSGIRVEDESGNEIYVNDCSNLQIANNDWVDEIYPEDSKVGSIGVLTCLEVQKGTFLTGTLNSDSFDPSLLAISIKGLGDTEFITSISYGGKEIDDLDFYDTITKNFIANLEY